MHHFLLIFFGWFNGRTPGLNALKEANTSMALTHHPWQANTKLAPRWRWIEQEAAHCGEVGLVQKLYSIFPHKDCGYTVKFDDGDMQV